jgi:hypothetical protein
MKISLQDFSVNVERKHNFKLRVGNESLQEISDAKPYNKNNNRVRRVKFTTQEHRIVERPMFLHLNVIHIYTYPVMERLKIT